MTKSTLIAGLGVLLFVLIVSAVVAMKSSSNILGQVAGVKRVGTAKELEKVFGNARIASGNELDVHRALRDGLWSINARKK